MSRSRMPVVLGTAVVAGAGYYLYSAGGNAKVAEAKLESDLRSVRDSATASGQQAHTEAQNFGAQAGAKVDEARNKAGQQYARVTAEAREAADNAAKKAEAYAKDAQARINQGADVFDKKVEETAAKTKSNVSSWFGGK
ncbi:hypothetical protein CMQ_1714 [Grosmannia clavigera kw1407]|uniref:Calcofluor white hypersensitive protein n=1 Tax=Grosmannia clavigera (strain kw1407 / UAMH 11150) TaxID=655863 RepID=F0XFW7_GROCL|nr:uncharacterized protein CMQ_1714 [Grosmannia clavigera kw1407]EFX04786.1 hypothetical protein CMQ_1714 [Grosmannia clavigera kw1407]